MKEPMEALIRAFVKVEYPLKQGLKLLPCISFPPNIHLLK